MGNRHFLKSLAGIIRAGYRQLPISEWDRRSFESSIFFYLGFLLKRTGPYRRWQAWRLAHPGDGHEIFNPRWRIDPSHGADFSENLFFPNVESPEVSVVIPVFNQARFTWRCLKSLARHATRHSFEIIVVDDGSTDETPQALAKIPGLHYLTNGSNRGFVYSCNRGASVARGRYLVFLNNDTQVLPGWLDELVLTFAAFPDAGLAGSKLIDPDGHLQEAG